jgi:hypothetical protein
MLWKTLVGVLATVALAEGALIVFGRHSINRFRAVDVDGYMAFDSATGQLCRTIRMKSTSKGVQYSPSADHAPESHLGNPTEDKTSKRYDRILDAIRNSPSNTEAAENYRVELIRDLPACADIR